MLLPLLVLIGEVCLLLRTDAFDPCLRDLLVRQLVKLADASEQELLDAFLIADVETFHFGHALPEIGQKMAGASFILIELVIGTLQWSIPHCSVCALTEGSESSSSVILRRVV